jgi:putative aldouronate transport system permease protein
MSKPYKVFLAFNYIALSALGLICLLPIVHVFAISFSSQVPVSRGLVSFWPVQPTLSAYQYVLKNNAFWTSMYVSFIRVIAGLLVNMSLTILVAYPLSKDDQTFPARTKYVFYFFFTMLFSGGLIPTFLVVRYTGLLDTLWAMVLPGAVQIYSVILLLNFFRQLPKELLEAAYVDGATHVQTLVRIVLPCSTAAIATVSLFCMVGHWNEWFSPIIYMKNFMNYPLQTYLRSVLIDQRFEVRSLSDTDLLNLLSNRTISSAQIFIGMLPILAVYPFLQKYFAKGIVLGSVKG